jgi:hypothetical protein
VQADSAAAAAAAGSASSVDEPVRTSDGLAVVDQADVYKHVFMRVDEGRVRDHGGVSCVREWCLWVWWAQLVDVRYFVGVVSEFIRSLAVRSIPVHHYMCAGSPDHLSRFMSHVVVRVATSW